MTASTELETTDPGHNVADYDLARVLGIACSLTKADGAAIALCDERGVLCRASTGKAPSVGSRLRSESGLTGECFRTGQAIWCHDMENDARVDAAIAKRLQARSALILPIQARGSTLGIIEVLSCRKSAFNHEHLAILRRLVELISSDAPAPAVKPALPQEQSSARQESVLAVINKSPAQLGNPDVEIVPCLKSAADEQSAPVEDHDIESALKPDNSSEAIDAILGKVSAPCTSEAATTELPPEQPLASQTEPDGSETFLDVVLRDLRSSASVPGITQLLEQEQSLSSQESPPELVTKLRTVAAKASVRNLPWHAHVKAKVGESSALTKWHESELILKLKESVGTAIDLSGKYVAGCGLEKKTRLRNTSPNSTLILSLVLLFAAGCLLLWWVFFHRQTAASYAEAHPTLTKVSDSTFSPAVPVAAAMSKRSGKRDRERHATSIRRYPRTIAAERRSAVMDPTTPMRQPPPLQPQTVQAPELALASPGSLPNFSRPAPQAVIAPTSHPVAAQLIYKVPPTYPEAARRLRLIGKVVLNATITKDGKVQDVQWVSGNRIFRDSSVAAVKQWRYNPASLNGQTVDSDLQIVLQIEAPVH